MVAGQYTHIKRVHMEGFRSYKDQTNDNDVEAFSKHTNVIVGKNGSGKSNFFLAIKFVLSDAYSTLQREDRRRLLHETDSEDTTLSARVEIVFDNSDGRFPIEKDEVVLRRDIGFKKEEYYLDSHQVKKADVSNFLESAGFSRSNPYYIVQQGKVSALTVMKDSERLELLKEVAGTRVYDERKSESLKIITETEDKVGQVDEMLVYINQRLDELSAEKDELKKYQDLDRKKRALEYAMYDTELHEAQEKLVRIDLERSEMSQNASGSHKSSIEKYAKIRQLEKDMKIYAAQLQTQKDERELLDTEKQELLRAKAKIDIDVGESRDKKKKEEDRVKELNAQLKAIEKNIQDRIKRLETAKQDYQTAMNEENTVAQNIASHELRLTELYAKQGRSAVYKTVADRDKALNKEIKETEADIKKHEEQAKEIKKQLDDAKKEVQKKAQHLKENASRQTDLLAEIDKSQKAMLATKDDRDKTANLRKDLWKQENDLINKATALQEQCSKARHQLSGSMPKSVNVGLHRVNEIYSKNKDKIRGTVYGPLIELFDVEPGYETCVEVAAGNSLFHVVVDSDTTAADILEIMQTQRDAGRVSFIPLNKITGTEPKIPTNQNVESMMSKIKIHDNKHRKAFLHIFAKTAITRDLEVAAAYARENDINCITMDGDQVNRKGALTGGYHDVRFSRIEAHKATLALLTELHQVNANIKEIQEKLKATDDTINRRLGEMQTNEKKVLHLRSQYEQYSHEVQNLGKDVELQQEALDTKERALAEAEVLLRRQRDIVAARRAELGTPLQSTLSAAEQAELHKTNDELAKLKESAFATAQTRAQAERERNDLSQELTENFNRRKAEVTAELASVAVSDEVLTLQQREADLNTITKALEASNTTISKLDDLIKESNTRLNETKTKIDKTKEEENEANKELEAQTKAMEKLLNKRSVLLQKREECTRKIRELGSLPTNALAEYKDHTLRELMAELKEVNVKLKDYSSVNKKALDQYVSFSDQKTELTKRKDELDKGREAIQVLIESLDMKKDEAIERTFKGVAKNFNEIFKELIPAGSASLRISRDEDPDPNSQSSQSSQSSQPSQKSRVMRYNGISIRCSFTGKDETMLLHQLSGGQKSLVALVLIFAIQRADPAPFYLFDEVDAALDEQYRSAVAQMIKRQSENTQFIISTFHKPMAEIADQWYEVRLKHDISKLVSVKKQDAMKIIELGAKQRAQKAAEKQTPKQTPKGKGKGKAQAEEEEEEEESEEDADGDVTMADR